PERVRDLQERPALRSAGVVDQDVHLAEGTGRLAEGTLAALGGGDVGGDGGDLHAWRRGRLDLRLRLAERLGAARDERDMAAGARIGLGDGEAEALGSARDQGG